MELVQWFLREAFGFTMNTFQENYDPRYLKEVGQFERFDQTLIVTNVNILLYIGLGKLN